MEEITLKKIDMLRERANLSYEEAEEILENSNGDIIEALVFCEREKEKKKRKFSNEKIDIDEFIEYIRSLIKSGNVTRIIIRNENNILVNIPINAGIIVGFALLLQPILILIGAATAVVVNLEIDIIKADGSVEVVNKFVKTTVEHTVDKAGKVTEVIKEKASHTTKAIKNKLGNMRFK